MKLSLFYKYSKAIFAFVLAISLSGLGLAQPYSLYSSSLEAYKNSSAATNPILDVPTVQGLNKKVGRAILKVDLGLGAIYKYGDQASSKDFKTVVTFKLIAYDATNAVMSGVFEDATYSLIINNNKPAAYFYKDITKFKNEISAGNESLTISKVKIENIVVTNSGNIASVIQNDVEVNLTIDVEYGVDVVGHTVNIIPTAAEINGGRVVTFSWDNGGKLFPNYQFQLVRLYNTNPADTSEKSIVATVDWKKALNLETEGSNTSIQLTVAEGTGYYIWRVRPVGTYFKGGVANSKNTDDAGWSSPISSSAITITSPVNGASISNSIFFFHEPDASRNWIYGRSFSEGNKMSEQITYATGLQQQKQKQAFLKSKNTTVITQNIYDYSGRPAVSTMPVPVNGNSVNSPYKTGFAKNKGDSLYSARNFDKNSNYEQPDSIKQAASEYLAYYSENNPSQNISSAEGYPFTRVLYYNDGQNRVKEQSGVGKTHMIGKVKGMGRTVKTIYGTPSDDELVRLFGEEAPDNEGVIKTVTVDQNGTASVSYTSRDGKVIATALTFKENSDSLLLPLEGEASRTNPSLVRDHIKHNIKSDSGFTSTKRLVLLDSSAVGLSYSVSCPLFERLCDNVSVDCKYKVRIRIFNIDKQTVVYNSPLTNLSSRPCEANDTLGTGTFKIVHYGSIVLGPGTYVVEKSLISDVNPAVSQSEARDRIDKQIKPISTLIISWLDSVSCESELNTFYISLDSLVAAFTQPKLKNTTNVSQILNNPLVTSKSLPFNFTQEFKDSVFKYRAYYGMEILKVNGFSTFAIIGTPCCYIKIPVDWTPPLRCPDAIVLNDRNGNERLDINVNFGNQLPIGEVDNVTELNPDFEGYAMNFLRACPVLRAAPGEDTTLATFQTYFYDNVMKGWPKGTFNLMVYHMLTDQYNCSNGAGDTTKAVDPITGKGTASSSAKRYDDCGNLIGQSTQNGAANCNSKSACVQYACQDLIDCWMQQLKAYKEIACNKVNIKIPGNAAVSDSFDLKHQSEPDKTNHNDQFDDNFKMTGIEFLDWIISKAISGRARDNQNVDLNSGFDQKSDYNRHIVKDFLDCTGYRFAKIITPVVSSRAYEASPLKPDSVPSVSNFQYLNGTGTNKTLNSDGRSINNYGDLYGDNKYRKGLSLDVYYVPFSNWKVNPPSSPDGPGLFPLIKNPVFAFKYFEYVNLNSSGQPLRTYNSIEQSSCYRDFNDCIYPDANGVQIFTPCCGTVGDGPDYCYKDYNYPNLANINDGTVGTDGGGKYKLTVNDFCNVGRVRCPYTHEYWSCGQRMTFYQTIKNVKANPASVDDFYTNTNPKGCSDVIVPGQGFKDKFEHEISYVDYQANVMTQSCSNQCNSQIRRLEFEREIRAALKKSCYIIGACAGGDSVLQEEDIKVMVDSLVKQCQYQCPITTYTCYDKKCRSVDVPFTRIGPDYFQLKPNLEFGVGGSTTDPCSIIIGSTTKPCNPIAPFSYKEYTLWKQATEWVPDILFDCKCRDVINCPDHVTRNICTSSEEKDGTNMSRDEYLLRTDANTPLDAYNIKINDPVYSPYIKKTFNR